MIKIDEERFLELLDQRYAQEPESLREAAFLRAQELCADEIEAYIALTEHIDRRVGVG